MGNEGWQTLSQVAVAIGIVLTALGGLGAYVFGQRIEREKDARAAHVGQLVPTREALLSAHEQLWPKLEFGDSGAVLLFKGPEGTPLFRFADGSGLTIIRVNGAVKVSLTIRNRSGAVVAELKDNEWKVNPNQSWDRNYTTDTLEVKDPSGDIVLQVRALSDRVQLQAKLYDATGRGFAFGKIVGPQGVGGGIEMTGEKNPELKMRFTPLFKYPSDLHLGVLLVR